MISRSVYAVVVLLCIAQAASAQTVDVSVLIDDPNAPGCNVNPVGLPLIAGIDARLTASVDQSLAQVTNVTLFLCSGGSFGAPTSIGGGQPVGNNTGLSGADVVELSVARSLITSAGGSLQLAAMTDNGIGVDVSAMGTIGSIGSSAQAIPALGATALLLLGILLVVLAAVAIKRQRILMSVLLCGMAFAVWAMNFMDDGQVGDWSSIPPLSVDPSGDATNGQTAADLVALFAAQGTQGSTPTLFFRVDMADVITSNQPPLPRDDNLATDEDTPLSGNLFADHGNGVDSDPDGDPFTVTMVAGAASVGVPVNLPSGAQITVNADGSFSYLPLGAFNFLSVGQTVLDSITYQIDDGLSGAAQATVAVTITGLNDLATAVNDSFATGVNTALNPASPGVLGNDTDPDTADTLSAVLNVAPGNALSFTLNADGSFSYVPATGFNGTDSFTYHVNDGSADSNVVTATIIVGTGNNPPVANNASFNIAENSVNNAAVGTVIANDPDAGNVLSYVISAGNTNTTFGINANTGDILLNTPPGVDFETPPIVFNLTVTVSDNGTPALTDTAAITINVTDVNEPPAITSAASANSPENQTSVIDVQSTDPDGDSEGSGLSYTITGGADQGAFSIVGATGVLTFNSAPNFEIPGDADMNNVYVVQVTVTDSGSLVDAQTINVSVTDVNEAPLVNNEAFAVQSNVGIQPNAAGGLIANDSDPDAGDSITLVPASVGTFTTTAGGTITTSADGSFLFTPQAGSAGVADSFAYSIEDSGGLTANATVTFNVDSNTIWFVDLVAGATGDGTRNNPFDSLADLDNGGPDGTGETIFLYTSDASTRTNGLSDDFDLQDNQFLIGEGATGVGTINDLRGFTTQPFSLVLPAIGTGPNHALTSSANGGITLASGNTIRGVDIGNTGVGTGITGLNFGTLVIDDVNITGSGGVLGLDTGTVTDPTPGDATFGTLSTTSNPMNGIDLNNVGGGFVVSGNTDIMGGSVGIDINAGSGTFQFGATSVSAGTDAGINIVNSATGAFIFDSLDVSNDNGSGLVATSGGTLTVNGVANSINSTGGAAVDIDNTVLDVTISTITTTSSPVHGIDLTAVSGTRFTVTGNVNIDMAAGSSQGINVVTSTLSNLAIGSGATVSVANRRTTGIFLSALSNTVLLGATNIANPNGAGGQGIHITNSTANFTFSVANISNSVVTSAQTFTDVDPGIGQRFLPDKNGDGDAVFLDTLSGSFTLNGGLIQDIGDNAIDVFDSSNVTINGLTISDSADADVFSTANTAIQVTASSGIVLRDTSISNFGNEVAAATTIRENAIAFRDVSGTALMQRCSVSFGSGFVFERFSQLPENIGLEIENRSVDLAMVVSGSSFSDLDFQAIQARHLDGNLSLIVDGANVGDGVSSFTRSNGAAVDFGQTAADGGASIGNVAFFATDFTDVGIGPRIGVLDTANVNLTVENSNIIRSFSDAMRVRGFGGATASTVTGRIPGNLFQDVGLAVSTIAAQNPGAGNGLEMLNELRTNSTIFYDNNRIDTVVDNGGSIGVNIANNSLSNMDLVFTNNTVSGVTADGMGADPAQDFRLLTSASGVGDSSTCLALTGNDMTPTSPIGIFGLAHDFLFDTPDTSVVTLEDYATPTADMCSTFALPANPETFIRASNTVDQTCAVLDALGTVATAVDPAPGGADLCTRLSVASSIAAVGSTTVTAPASLQVLMSPAIANTPVRFTASTGGGGQTAVFPAGNIAYTNASGIATLPIQSNTTSGSYTVAVETIPPTGAPVVYTVTNL